METKWSCEQVEVVLETAVKMQTELLFSEERYRDAKQTYHEALRAAYDAGLGMDKEKLQSAHEALAYTSRRCSGIRQSQRGYQDVIEAAMREASLHMTLGDYKELCRHDLATYLLKKLPHYPTGEIYQISWPMTLETAAFHARNHWDQSGCHYTSEAHYCGDEMYVTVVGTPRALLLWVCEEFDEIEDILQNFRVCEDPGLIRRYISQHRMVADATEELEEKMGTS